MQFRAAVHENERVSITYNVDKEQLIDLLTNLLVVCVGLLYSGN